jgi:hypothetical protein
MDDRKNSSRQQRAGSERDAIDRELAYGARVDGRRGDRAHAPIGADDQ